MQVGTVQEQPGNPKGSAPPASGHVDGERDTVTLGFAAMTTQAAPDDVVHTHEEGAANRREPLLVLEPLRAFLDERGLGAGDLEVEPVGEGHSNVTYSLRRDGAELVLRRPPRGPLPPSAHDVLREARVMTALAGRARVPAVLAVCDDPAVIGVPFYVMERVAGEVITSALPPALDAVDDRRRTGEELVDALVEVHGVEWSAAGLEGFGKPTGYLERQLRRFLGLWEHNRTRDIPAVEAVAGWLRDHLPESGPATVVHGDYRLGNTMFAPDSPARLVAIFDWEMATIGDPLADVGYLCALWVDRDDPPTMFELSGVTREEGFVSRAELVARYEERSGRSMTDIRWYRTLALWKSIVFMEGNYRRAVTGATDDPYLKGFGEGVVQLARRAEALARGG
jgi:aminoglycoside phosphotransferase (APT) family kinase protein